jgi:hypothetical protein
MAPDTNKLVQMSWAQVEALTLETVGVLFFKRVFEIAPEAITLFSFRDEANVSASSTALMHVEKGAA